MNIPRHSYSQMGEDLIVENLLGYFNLNKTNVKYFDIGSSDPLYGNNTYLFYLSGSSGILVDPNIEYENAYKKHRSKDLFLNFGVAGNSIDKEKELFYYHLTAKTLNTFDKNLVDIYCSKVSEKNYGIQKIEKVNNVKIVNINYLIENYVKFNIDFVSIDVEGYDLEIIKSWNFNKWKPKIICIEIDKLQLDRIGML
jgi:FkbM family methyltransferase